MNRSVVFALIMLFFGSMIFCQDMPDKGAEAEAPESMPENPADVPAGINQRGDQLIQISGTVGIPFTPKNIKVGGSGIIGYSYYFTRWFSLGGSLGFAYSSTLGSNVFYFVPALVKPTFHFYVWRFEFAVTAGIGGAFEAYIDRNYFGLCVKPEVAAFYRFLPNWSIGVNTGLYVLPQWYKNSEYNRTGLIMDVGISARYHF